MSRVAPEKWHDGEVRVVARTAKGQFAPGSTSWKPLELWNTRKGPKVKFTGRDAAGRFTATTNFPTVL